MILRHMLKLCWDSARKKHREDAKFAIIAYGKLGGKELGYASDLDLIFLYDDDHPMRRKSMRDWASASTPCWAATPHPGDCMKPTCACARMAQAVCW